MTLFEQKQREVIRKELDDAYTRRTNPAIKPSAEKSVSSFSSKRSRSQRQQNNVPFLMKNNRGMSPDRVIVQRQLDLQGVLPHERMLPLSTSFLIFPRSLI